MLSIANAQRIQIGSTSYPNFGQPNKRINEDGKETTECVKRQVRALQNVIQTGVNKKLENISSQQETENRSSEQCETRKQ